MASSESELQPEPRISWPNYVDDTDTVFIALHQRMSSLVLYPEVSEHLSQLDQARYGKNDMDTAIEFCKFASVLRNPNMFEGVFRFLAHEGVVAGVDKHDKDHRLCYPLKLHVALAFRYPDTELDELLKPTLAAIYSNNPRFFPRCLPGTRVGLIDQVLAKITSEQPLDQPLLVAGSAGTGKSALAASVLQALKARRIPVLSFVCKHDVPERSDPQFVIPTLAWQLSKYPLHRSGVEEALRKLEVESSNPVDISPVEQVELLTTLPSLGSSLQRPVILIDALDESGQTTSRKQLIEAFIDNADALCSRFTVIIVSRPIDQIQKHVRPKTWTIVDWDTLLQSDGTTADMRRFFVVELSEVAPTSGQIDDLVVAANGLFVWARVACSYIILLYDPTDAKQALSAFCGGLAPAGSSEPLGMPTQNLELFRRVISSILFAGVALSAAGIAWLVDRSETAVESLLDRLRPLLAPDDGSSEAPVRLLHASVDDFFRSLAEDDKFFVPPRHAQCFNRCFETMVAELSFNFAGVTDPREVMRGRADLENIRASVSERLRYSCFQWAWHLSSLGYLDSASLKVVEHFFERVFLYWLELVGMFDSLAKGARWLRELAAVTGEPLREISNDASDFLRHHHNQAESSPCHIYVSALPLALHQSTIAKYYYSSLPKGTLPRITIGLTSRITPTLTHSSDVFSIDFSPIDNTVLTVTKDTIKVFDSIGGAQITALTLPTSRFVRAYYSATGTMIVAHSKPNTSRLSGVHGAGRDQSEVTLWDTSAYKMTKLEMRHDTYITAFSLREYFPERHMALFSGNSKLVAVWDLESDSPRRQELDENGEYAKFRASRDGSTVFMRTHDHSRANTPVKLWCAANAADAYVNMPLPVLIKANERLRDMAISSEGSRLAFRSDDDSEIVVVDLKLGSSLRVKAAASSIRGVRFTADISQLVTLSWDHVVTAYDLRVPGTMVWSLTQMFAGDLAVSRDGSRFAFVRYLDRSKVQISDAGQSTVESKDDSDGRVRSAHVSNDGQYLLLVTRQSDDRSYVERWDPLTGRKLASLDIPIEFSYYDYAMSPDGSLFAVSGNNNNISYLNMSTGNVIWNSRTYSQGILPNLDLKFAFSPNNAHLLCAGYDTSNFAHFCLVLLDAVSGEVLKRFVLLGGGLRHSAFSADSSRICGVHDRQEPAGIVIWTVNRSKPYLQLQAPSSSTGGSGDDHAKYQVVWTAADSKVVTITSNSKPTLTCWDPETCTRLAIVRISIPVLSEYVGSGLVVLASLVGPVFGGLKLPTWLAESTNQVIGNQDGVQRRVITLLDRWRYLALIPTLADDDRLAEHAYPDGSKMELISCLQQPIVIHYPSEDPWANFCKSMVGFQMPKGQLLPFFKAKCNATELSTLLAKVAFTAQDLPYSANNLPKDPETSLRLDSSSQLPPSAVATLSHASGFQIPEGKLVPIFEAKPNANERSTSSFEDSVAKNLPYPANDHRTDVEAPASSNSSAQLTSLRPATSSRASIDTLQLEQASASKSQGWRERLGIKSSKNKGKGKGKAD